MIAWYPPANQTIPIEYYVVHYRTVGPWVPLTEKINAEKTTYVWKTSSYGVQYRFVVYSFTKTALSEASAVVTFHSGGEYMLLCFSVCVFSIIFILHCTWELFYFYLP